MPPVPALLCHIYSNIDPSLSRGTVLLAKWVAVVAGAVDVRAVPPPPPPPDDDDQQQPDDGAGAAGPLSPPPSHQPGPAPARPPPATPTHTQIRHGAGSHIQKTRLYKNKIEIRKKKKKHIGTVRQSCSQCC